MSLLFVIEDKQDKRELYCSWGRMTKMFGMSTFQPYTHRLHVGGVRRRCRRPNDDDTPDDRRVSKKRQETRNTLTFVRLAPVDIVGLRNCKRSN